MPISLAKVRDRTVHASLVLENEALFGDEKPTLECEYRPSVLTPLFESELRAFGDNSDGWAKLVSRLVASWDFEGEDGRPVSLEFEELRKIPGPFLTVVVAAIREHIVPNSKTDGNSGDGSSPAASSDESPTTTRSFEQPVPLESRRGN